MSIEQKLQTLLQIKLDIYRALDNPHPEIAAQYAVQDILNMYKHSTDLEILLEDEIEDSQDWITFIKFKQPCLIPPKAVDGSTLGSGKITWKSKI